MISQLYYFKGHSKRVMFPSKLLTPDGHPTYTLPQSHWKSPRNQIIIKNQRIEHAIWYLVFPNQRVPAGSSKSHSFSRSMIAKQSQIFPLRSCMEYILVNRPAKFSVPYCCRFLNFAKTNRVVLLLSRALWKTWAIHDALLIITNICRSIDRHCSKHSQFVPERLQLLHCDTQHHKLTFKSGTCRQDLTSSTLWVM